MDATEKIFAYGSLKDPNVQQKVLGKKVSVTPDRLEGCIESDFEHVTTKTRPIILSPFARHGISGVTFAVTTADLQKIDQYQSNFYHREKVTLKSGDSAWAYVK